MAQRVLQLVGVGLATAAGLYTHFTAVPHKTFPVIHGVADTWPWAVAIGFGVLIIPYILVALGRWVGSQIHKMKLPDLIAATVGLLVGSLIALLLTVPLAQVKILSLNIWLPLFAALLFGYLGIAISVLKREEIQHAFSSVIHRRRENAESDDVEMTDDRPQQTRRGRRAAQAAATQGSNEKVVLDTSAIIDGRIADISQTGFIMGTIVVPRFVLEELQHIADSADSLRRNRGRRGLDILNRLKETSVPVEITDADFDNVPEVDAKLVKLAKNCTRPSSRMTSI